MNNQYCFNIVLKPYFFCIKYITEWNILIPKLFQVMSNIFIYQRTGFVSKMQPRGKSSTPHLNKSKKSRKNQKISKNF